MNLVKIICRAAVKILAIVCFVVAAPRMAYAAVAISQTANPAGVSAASNVATYTSVDIGAAADDRIIAVLVGTELNNSTPSAATIDSGSGAVSMTAATGGSFGAMRTEIFYRLVPSGTSATITVTFSNTNPDNTQNHIAVYRVTGASDTLSASNSDGSTDMDASDPLTTGSNTIPSGGGFLAVAVGATDTVAKTWANAAEDIDADVGGMRFTTASNTTAGTAIRTVTGGTNNEDGALSYVVFQVTTAPTISTDAASGATSFSAVLNGQITANGGAASTVRGFAWGTNSTLSNGDTSTTTDTTGQPFVTGAFTQLVSGLIAGRTYYFRAYATNSAGTGFDSTSPILSFTASAADTTVSRKMRLFEGYRLNFLNGRIILYQR